MDHGANVDIWRDAGLADFIVFDETGRVVRADTCVLNSVAVGDDVFAKLPVLRGCEDIFDDAQADAYPIGFEGVALHGQNEDMALDFRVGRHKTGRFGLVLASPNASLSGDSARQTQQRRKLRFLENMLARERARFEFIYRNSPVIAFAIDGTGHVQGQSDQLSQWLGDGIDTERWIADFIELNGHQWTDADRQQTHFRTGVSRAAHCISIVDVAVLMSADRDMGTFIVLNDVTLTLSLIKTVQRQAENLAQAVAMLEISNRRLEQFAHVAAHDLLGPLGRMSSFSEVIELELKEGAQGILATAIDAIRISARESIDLVRDLLTLAKLQHFEPVAEDIDMAAFVAGIVDRLHTTDPVKVDYRGPAIISADRRLLHLIVRNLVANSYKYRSRERALCIEVNASPDADGALRMAFTDNGSGFDDDGSNPFAAFTRMREQVGVEGTGLGLAMVKDAADTMGWQAGISSRRGLGTTVFFTGIRQACE